MHTFEDEMGESVEIGDLKSSFIKIRLAMKHLIPNGVWNKIPSIINYVI